MSLTLSPTLTNEMNSLTRTPASKATVERWLPEWTRVGNVGEANVSIQAHGHTALVIPNGNGSGEDVLFRARYGTAANPWDGNIYTMVLKGADLDTPAGWVGSKWAYFTGGGFHPQWTSNSGLGYGAAMASVWTGSAIRLFYFVVAGSTIYLNYADFNLSGSYVGGGTLPISLSFSSSLDLGSLQVACSNGFWVYFLRTEHLEASQDSWQKPVYGSRLYAYVWNGSAYVLAHVSHIHTHAEGGLVRDGQFALDPWNGWGVGSADNIQAQWGVRPTGGLAASKVWLTDGTGNLVEDSNTAVISSGMTFYRRYGFNTHNQGLLSFRHYRDSGLWGRGFETGLSDYVDERLDFDVYARASHIETASFLVWTRLVEPSDYDQLEASQSLPRTREVVYARLSPDGKDISQFQYLGPHDELTAATLVAVHHAGAKKLYALGWQAVYTSPPASFICSVPTPQDLENYCTGWATRVDNRWGMSVDLSLEDVSAVFDPTSPLQNGSLVKVYAGTPAELTQLAQGRIDLNTPSLNLAQVYHRAKLNARADKDLLDTRVEEALDILPQNTLFIEPTDPITHIANHAGLWNVVALEWPGKFGELAGYSYLAGRKAYRMSSFPYAYTGGGPAGTFGDPGMVLNQRSQHKGTWFNDLAWTDMTPMVDGSIEASVRFGDVNAGGDFDFWDRNKTHVYATVSRSGTMITQIQWRTGGYGGGVWNYVNQAACMAGVICHAAEIGKKYAFVWEADTSNGGSRPTYQSSAYHADDPGNDYWADRVPASWEGRAKPFSGSSHTDDTWRSETMDRCDYYPYALGPNRLYLLESDYDETDPHWKTNQRWIHKVVAGGIYASGLTPGYPADLKMMVIGGVIYCFYRPHRTHGAAPSQWRFAFSYNAGRFGAGRFGIIGRGHAGIQWDAFYYAYGGSGLPTGRDKIPYYDNYVDFWDIKVSDAVMDRPLEEIVKRHAWQGLTPTVFSSVVAEPGPVVVNPWSTRAYLPAVENLTIDFDLSVNASGGEAGVICRAVSPALTDERHFRIGVVIGGGLPGATGLAPSYVVKRWYNQAGAEDLTALEYSPCPLALGNGPADLSYHVPIPVRITVRGNLYSVWIAGNYAGHFQDDTAGGVYFGLYSHSPTATFFNVRVPELYEVPAISSLDINQTIFDTIKKVLGQRGVKGVFQPTGAVKVSYFDTHADGPTLADTLTQSALRLSARFYSVVRVDGAYTWAIYASKVLLAKGRHFIQVSLPDIFHREFAHKEAKAICQSYAEDQVQATFTGLPDFRLQPEDRIGVTVAQQSLAGDQLINEVSFQFQMGDQPNQEMTVSTRRFFVI